MYLDANVIYIHIHVETCICGYTYILSYMYICIFMYMCTCNYRWK